MASRADRHDTPIRITTAEPGHSVDVSARQRRYLFSMAIRTACFIGAVAVGPGVLRWALVIGAVVLPYVAVVLASRMPTSSSPALPTAGLGRELGTTAAPTRSEPETRDS